MKILFTGMASSHCSSKGNVSFFNTIAKAVEGYAEVIWAPPKVSWTKSDLDSFDLVFFGFIPPTALSANKIYGAMHVLGEMFDSPKLRLVVDGQQIWQYKNSIEYIKRDVSKLFTDFYSKRAEYSLVSDPDKRQGIEKASELLNADVWPITYYPALPWTSHERAVSSLGFGTSESFVGVNLDAILLNPEPYSLYTRKDFWAVDNEKSQWVTKLSKSIRNPVMPLKSSRRLSDSDATSTMRTALGLIVTPQDRGVGSWWSYRQIQGLNSHTPIVTEWVDTNTFHKSWAYLGYQLEDMSEADRKRVAADQLDSYQSSLKNKKHTIDSFKTGILDRSLERI